MLKQKPKNLKKNQFSRIEALIFILAFAVIGIFLWKSFAATNPNLPGDVDNNDTVDIADLSLLLSSFNQNTIQCVTAPTYTCDQNGDSKVDIRDLSVVLSYFGQSVSAFTTNITQNMTINTPFTWTFNPGTTTTAGYFYADGVQLAKITGPGPYSFSLQTTSLTAGAHTLGGSWDLVSGAHVTFPQPYSVTVNNGSGVGGGPGTGYTGPWRDTTYTIPSTFTKVITTASAFKSLVSASGTLVAGDVVHVVGPMTLDGCGGCHTNINKFLSSPASIYIDSNVVFAGDTNTSPGFSAVYVDAANIDLYGGTIAGGFANGGLKIGPGFSSDTQTVANIKWWGVKIHDVGGSGVYAGGGNNGAGAFIGTTSIDIDAEVWNVGLNYLADPHTVDGTGLHAIYVGGSPQDPPNGIGVNNSKFSVYSHDSPQCVGDAEVGPSTQNTEFWIRANNLSFTNAANGGWTAARAFTPFTSVLNGNTNKNIIVHNVEAHNVSGPVVFDSSLGSGPVTVEYGRGVNVLTWSTANSYFNGNPFQPNSNVIYQNIQ